MIIRLASIMTQNRLPLILNSTHQIYIIVDILKYFWFRSRLNFILKQAQKTHKTLNLSANLVKWDLRALTLCMLGSYANNHYKHFGPRSGPTNVGPDLDPKTV